MREKKSSQELNNLAVTAQAVIIGLIYAALDLGLYNEATALIEVVPSIANIQNELKAMGELN